MSQLTNLDAEIAAAEQAAERAFAQQRAMGRDVPHAEAVATARLVKDLEKRVSDLRVAKLGAAAPAEPPPSPELQRRLDWLEAQVKASSLSAERTQRSIANGIASATAEVIKAEHERMLAHVHEEKEKAIKLLRKEIDVVRVAYSQSATRSANKLLEMRELREQSQAAVERDILAYRREIADLREELRALKAHGLVAAPFNGSGAHSNDNP
jgi:hypothetical protein